MAARATWKGFIKLSLVSVPVKAFTAHETQSEIHLNQLHANCHQRVRYAKRCPEHGDLEAKDIVSGYEYAKGQYVVIDPEEVSKLREQSDRALAIAGFVKPEAVDPIFHAGKTYYLLPDGVAGQKPYALLCQGMIESGVAALVQVVLAGREQLALLRPSDKMLVLTVLHYAANVRGKDEFVGELNPQSLGKDELGLTRTLIDATRIADVDLAQYKDRYVERLTKLIELKVEGKEIVEVKDREEPKILNLMEALKRSVAEAQATTARAAGELKMAPSEPAPTAAKKPAKKKSG
jgi:DNA end-binding protein Ku